MTRSVLLNAGQLETALVLPVVSLRSMECYTKIFKTNGQITQKSIYADNNMATELYRVVPNRINGQIVSVTETDYTRNPVVVITRVINRAAGQIDNIDSTGPSQGLTPTLRLNWSMTTTLTTLYGVGYG